MIKKLKKKICFGLGLSFLILAMIGIIIPLLPTTPFALLAVYFFDHSSKKFHQWCLRIPGFGKGIEDWSQHKIIRVKAKIQAIVLLLASAVLIFYNTMLDFTFKMIIISFLGLVLTFILSRPSKIKN